MGILEKKLIKPILAFLKQGITPKKLALSISLGVVLGFFPVIGVTSILCFVAAIVLKLNMAAIQLINYLVYPLQILLIIPFIKLGSWLLNINPIPYSLSKMVDMIDNNLWEALEKLWWAHLMGVFAWSVTVIPLGIIVYLIATVTFKKFIKSSEITES